MNDPKTRQELEDEHERDIREQCKWDEALSEKLDREDYENGTGDYAEDKDE